VTNEEAVFSASTIRRRALAVRAKRFWSSIGRMLTWPGAGGSLSAYGTALETSAVPSLWAQALSGHPARYSSKVGPVLDESPIST
jgi:hypothetical protein